MKIQTIVAGLGLAGILAGCASAPLAPRVAVMPAPGKPFEQFVAEERMCRQYAEQAVGGGQDDPGERAAISSAAVGTAVGALAGAAVGGRQGAAVGAGGGLIVGTAAGSGRAGMTERDIQRRYDIAYQQCMYAKGNQIPGQYAPYAPQSARPAAAYPPPPPPPAAANPPPPPPGR